jgi:hypothetical protein
MKIKFIGKTDNNFTNGNTYQLFAFKIAEEEICKSIFGTEYKYLYHVYISNNDNKIVIIPYVGMDNFNKNWEVVNE